MSRILDRRNLSWRASLTYSLNRNEIVHLYGDMVDVLDASGNVIGQKEGDDIQNKWFIGHAVDEIWEPRILGVWQIGEETEAARYGQNPGDFKLLDKDNNGKINEIDNEFLGFRRPRFQWNMRHDFNIYKNFDLSLSCILTGVIWVHLTPQRTVMEVIRTVLIHILLPIGLPRIQ